LKPLEFKTEIIEWRGPSPFYFAALPQSCVEELRTAARSASYGWGVVPVDVQIGKAAFTTSLFPRDGGYMLPLKDAVRYEIGATIGDRLEVCLTVRKRS
jgi:Domain of unknown function (DUF1905)